MHQWIKENIQKLENFCKAVIFILGGILLFVVCQQILMPKWYYPDTTLPEAPTRTMDGFYEEEGNSLDVIMIGTSHTLNGISPMELYDRYGICSYNLATSAQSIEVSYYILKESLQTQKPKVVIYDVSSMWFGAGEEPIWRYVLDGMKFGITKIEFAKAFSKQNESWSLVGALFPLWRYHDNWKTLTKQNFTDFSRNKNFYSKGYYLTSQRGNSGITVEYMNRTVEELLSNNEKVEYIYKDGIYQEERYESVLYSVEISESRLQYLQKIKELCKENGAELLLTKVPTCRNPITYYSSWTKARSDKIKEICSQYGVPFFDMLYDGGIDIDWDTDTVDGGAHMNFLGACKVSECLGGYLMQNYSIGNKWNTDWNKDFMLYQKLSNVALLGLERNFTDYIQKLAKEYKDKIIFIAASDDMAKGLDEKDKEALQELGIQTDFTNACRNSFLAVIENGVVCYEALSNRSLSYSGETPLTQTKFLIQSSGYYTASEAGIYIEGKNYSMNHRGINLVVYDEENDCVLDSVCFDTCTDVHECIRNSYETARYLAKLESILIEK